MFFYLYPSYHIFSEFQNFDTIDNTISDKYTKSSWASSGIVVFKRSWVIVKGIPL